MIYDTLCMSGGGLKTLYYIGLLECLEKNKKFNINNINNFIGTSAGAIICFFLSLSYSIIDIKKFLIDFNFKILVPEINIDNIFNNFGIDEGNKIKYIFIMFFKNKLKVEDITFLEHYELTKKKFSCIGCNYTKKKESIFNYIKTPNMSIITALRISMSIPLFFTPVLYENEYYIDGAVFNNFPFNHCNINTTLGINIDYIKRDEDNKLTNLLEFIMSSFTLLINSNKNNYNTLNVINIKNYNCTNLIDFELSYHEKEQIIKSGFDQGEFWIQNLSFKICESIINNIINSINYNN